jgi:hypothetical protein
VNDVLLVCGVIPRFLKHAITSSLSYQQVKYSCHANFPPSLPEFHDVCISFVNCHDHASELENVRSFLRNAAKYGRYLPFWRPNFFYAYRPSVEQYRCNNPISVSEGTNLLRIYRM